MANKLYPSAREAFLTGDIDWVNDTISLALLDSTYIYDDAHVYLSSVPTAAIVGGVKEITARTAGAGYADGSSLSFPLLTHTAPLTQVVIFIDTGDTATSAMLVHYDSVNGLPFTPTGDNYDLFPDALFGGYFRV